MTAIIVVLGVLLILGVLTGLHGAARSGSTSAIAVPYRTPQPNNFNATGGAAWPTSAGLWRATGPLMRLELLPDSVRIGPSNRLLQWIIPTLELPRITLRSVETIDGRGLRPACVRFSTDYANIDFWGASTEVIASWYRQGAPA